MADQDELQPKVAWGITGAGHFLSECIELLTGLKSADIFLSDAGKEVLNYYGWYKRLTSSGHSLIQNTGASCLPVTPLYTGKYDLVIIAPITSNTVAKMACGIADNLITNLFAHAGKCRIPTILLPCDSMAETKSLTPQGKQVSVHTREIDRENIVRLSKWSMVTLANDPQQLLNLLTRYNSERQV